MAGRSLHLGLNKVVESKFSALPLDGCIADALAMGEIAASRGFDNPEVLQDQKATFAVVESKIREIATSLKGGDIFLFTFAGHGSQLGDENGDELESRDEAIVLYDFMMSDDFMRLYLWPCFKPNVRILMVSDSCHSGTVAQFVNAVPHATGETNNQRKAVKKLRPGSRRTELVQSWRPALARMETGVASYKGVDPVFRQITENARLEHIKANKEFYTTLFAAPPPCGHSAEASVLLLAACRDDELAADGLPHGAFTQILLNVWDGGKFQGNYDDFIGEISKKFAGTTQNPMLTPKGQLDFRSQPIFSV